MQVLSLFIVFLSGIEALRPSDNAYRVPEMTSSESVVDDTHGSVNMVSMNSATAAEASAPVAEVPVVVAGANVPMDREARRVMSSEDTATCCALFCIGGAALCLFAR